ncbi:hypothetical protein [Haloarcula nitratireducens]|uniref:GIY-YIG domain-containing protein n=1 Tax=Haloarcula nitratireducens TaxID=2487749 RepID=A0AAW4PJI9_9EURY|nr:hypothetical protein [Halomicroarcula nitratireducens]MBX0298149.1 hypothetical protein [Halomicroarcula nitratireducens]
MQDNTRHQVRKLKAQDKSQLKQSLADELDGIYNRQITNSLRNDLMTACFGQIEPKQGPFEKVQSHENYSPSWSNKKQLATALRMSLSERVDRPEHDGITSLNKQVIAELIVAIRQTDTSTQDRDPKSEQSGTAPERTNVSDSPFDDTLPAADFDNYALYTWIVERRTTSAGEHGVYVLDCTPPIGEDEDFRVSSLRQDVSQKSNTGQSLTKIEKAAAALNRGERLYYVGYASDVPTRIRQHVSGADSGGAKFTNLFSPQALVDVSWYQTEMTARSEERRRATELTVSGESFGYAE